MSGQLILIGLNHKTAPLEIREKFAFKEETLDRSIEAILELDGIKEGMILSTCNRVEILVCGRDIERSVEQLKRFLSQQHSIPLSQFEDHLYVHTSKEAVRHLFTVASSLDSMVIGEPQILGQLKEAYRTAVKCRGCGTLLNNLLHRAFRVAKKVRTDTAIGAQAVSVSFAAVELARKIFESLEKKAVMLVGAGEMIELAARHFIANGVKEILITNRTYKRAESLAESFNGKAIHFDEFRLRLAEVDILLSCTGAPNYIISQGDIRKALKLRKSRPMFLIDIAVPRDIDPTVNELENVYLYDIDDLQEVVQRNLEERRKEAKKAEAIIEAEVLQFERWLRSLDVTPTIVQLRKKMEEIRAKELVKTFSSLKHLEEKERKTIEAMTSAIINKILHHPITELKRSVEQNGDMGKIEAIRKIFNLNEEEEDR